MASSILFFNPRLAAEQQTAGIQLSQLNKSSDVDVQNLLKAMSTATASPNSSTSKSTSGAFDKDELQQIIDLGNQQSQQKVDQINAEGANADKVANTQGQWQNTATETKGKLDLAGILATVGGNVDIAGIQAQAGKDIAGIEAQGNLDATNAAGQWDQAKADTLGKWQNAAAETTGKLQNEGVGIQAEAQKETAKITGTLQNEGLGIQASSNEKIAGIEAATNKEISFGKFDSDERIANLAGEWSNKNIVTGGEQERLTSAQQSGERINETEMARQGQQKSKRDDAFAAHNLYKQRAFG